MKITIFVVSHKPYREIDNSLYETIQVGKVNTGLSFSEVSDDIGDNIAKKNPNYCELTAFYWLWKNKHDIDYIGICHYRRFFTNNNYLNTSKLFIGKKQIEKTFKSYDVILPEPLKLQMTVKEYYSYCDGLEKDLDMTKKIISERCPEYLHEFNVVLNSNSAVYCNMMIISKERFDKYCEWLFDILFEVEKHTNMDGYNKAQKRVFGYISEILLNVWILHNHYNVKYEKVINTETSFKYRIMHRN